MATSTPGNKKRSASQNLSGEDTKKLKLNNSTSAAEETTLSGETQGRDIYDEITMRNSEQSPLLRLPAELRIKIYQYALSGFVLAPAPDAVHRNDMAYVTFCAAITCKPLDNDWAFWEFDENLWSMTNSLSRSSRQLHAEIGETLFAESSVRYSAWWRRWLPMLSEKQKHAVRHVEIAVHAGWGTPSPVICNFIEMIDVLSNVKTVHVTEWISKLHWHIEEYIIAETEKRGLRLVIDRLEASD